jgi:hypothetical protein
MNANGAAMNEPPHALGYRCVKETPCSLYVGFPHFFSRKIGLTVDCGNMVNDVDSTGSLPQGF